MEYQTDLLRDTPAVRELLMDIRVYKVDRSYQDW